MSSIEPGLFTIGQFKYNYFEYTTVYLTVIRLARLLLNQVIQFTKI